MGSLTDIFSNVGGALGNTPAFSWAAHSNPPPQQRAPGIARTGYGHFGGGPTGVAPNGYNGATPAGAPPDPNHPSIARTGYNHFGGGPTGVGPQTYKGPPPAGAPGSQQPSSDNGYGSQSGPTTVENWFNQRANGTDPAWEYGIGRASDAINNQYAARGGYNSSGAMQSLSDMYSNAVSQREGQLDTLANQATGAHQNALNEQFNVGNSLATGQANTAGGYDTSSGAAQEQGLLNQMMLQLQRSGVDQKTAQGQIDALTNLFKTASSAAGGKAG